MAPDLPATAIALEYVVEHNAITKLYHRKTFDCGAPLPKDSLGVRTALVKKTAKVAPAWPSAEEMKQNPRYVAGDALQVKECYILNAPKIQMQRHRHILRAGAFLLARGGVICVDGIDRSGGELWYKARSKEIETLNPKDWLGWIDSQNLMEYGVRLSY